MIFPLKKEAKKRQQQRSKSEMGEDIKGSILQAAQDETLLSTPELPKPQPPTSVEKHKVSICLEVRRYVLFASDIQLFIQHRGILLIRHRAPCRDQEMKITLRVCNYKPTPTLDQIELEVLEVFSRTRRPPGEPIVHLELTQSSLVTEANFCADPEKRRRQAVNKTRVWIKVSEY